jgi:hypothetical protein
LGYYLLSDMSGLSLSTKLQVALAAQAIFALVLIFTSPKRCSFTYSSASHSPSQTTLFSYSQSLFLQQMLLLSFIALRSPRRAIKASAIAQLLVCLAAARFLVQELLCVARGEDVGWSGHLLIAGSAPVVLVCLTFAAVFYSHLAATCDTRNV